MMPDASLAMAAPLLKPLAAPTLSALGVALGWTVDKVKVGLALTFNDHFEAAKRKCSYVRTINNPDRNTPIVDIYVNLNLYTGSSNIRDDELLDHLDMVNKFIITGTAGAGKSMIMRRLLIQAMEEEYPLIPFFIDLRDVSDLSKDSIADEIFRLTTPESQRHNKTLFLEILDKAGVCLFLDGLDEVDPDWRTNLRRAVEDLLIRFPKLKVVISSRPDVDFAGWEEFETVRIKSLNLDQSISIVEKAEFFDEVVRQEFLDKLKAGEFKEHGSFLEIAMLNVILLMCYGEYLQLSEKFSSFYDQAYEVLYRRHDRAKGLRRKYYSGLPADEFKKVVSAFCYRTYVDFSLSFTEGKLSEYLTKSAKIAGVSADSSALAQDMTESVSLLQRDGTKIFFIHRSFQEYFTAKFMTEYRGNESFKVFDTIFRKLQSSKIGSMAYELNSELLERVWVLPFLDNIVSVLDDRSNDRDISTLKHIYLEIDIHHNHDGSLCYGGYSWTGKQYISQLRTLKEIYNIDKISEGFIVEDRRVLVDGVYLENYLAQRGREISMELEQDDSDDEHRLGTYQIPLQDEHPEWLERTDLPERLNELIGSMKALRNDVAKRVQERSSESVFE